MNTNLRPKVPWFTLAVVMMASWPLMAQEEEGGASVARPPQTVLGRSGAPAVTVDESQRVSYRSGGRTVSLTLVADRVLIRGKRGYETVPVDPGSRSGAVAQAARAEGEIQLFVTDTGVLRAPVGGVLLLLTDSWGPERVEAFLIENGLHESVTPLEWRRNGFFVNTEPGVFAIELSNRLEGMPGVVSAAPNFWTEVVER